MKKIEFINEKLQMGELENYSNVYDTPFSIADATCPSAFGLKNAKPDYCDLDRPERCFKCWMEEIDE